MKEKIEKDIELSQEVFQSLPTNNIKNKKKFLTEIDKEIAHYQETLNTIYQELVNRQKPYMSLTEHQYEEYDDIYSTEYVDVNLLDYITNQLEATGENEYMFEENPTGNMDKFIYLKDHLQSGTYRFVFALYDGDTFIGDCTEYVIIK